MAEKYLSFVYENTVNNIIYKILFKDINNLNIKPWKFNRPPDQERIKRIAYHVKDVQYVDGIIHLQYKDNAFYCYDGLHRLEALKMLNNSSYYKHVLKDMNILLNIRINATDGEIMDHFNMLNKCVPVPDIYVDIRNAKEIQLIENAVTYFSQTYPTHFSISRNPNIPNENKDRMKDRLKGILESYPDECHLIDILKKHNNYISENIPVKTSEKQLEKCRKSGFYLFLKRDWYML